MPEITPDELRALAPEEAEAIARSIARDFIRAWAALLVDRAERPEGGTP